MNAAANLAHYDFRRPSGLPDQIDHRLSAWQRAMCALVPEYGGRYATSPISLEHRQQQSMLMFEVRSHLPVSAIGYRCGLGAEDLSTMLVFSRPVLLALVNNMLGEVLEELPEDRSLTDVERSLCDLWLEELGGALSEAWPAQEMMSTRLSDFDPRPQRSRMFPINESMILSTFEVTGAFGTEPFYWILPREGITELLEEAPEGREASAQTSEHLIDQQAREIPASLVVRLGRAELDVVELANLRAGDLVILDQKITEPLVAEVAGEEKFRGWPGRVGVRQAFQVATVS